MQVIEDKNLSRQLFDEDTEIVLHHCLTNDLARELLERASKLEEKFSKGMVLNNGTALLKGFFDEKTGLLRAKLELGHGDVYYECQDLAMNKIKITSVPGKTCIESPYELTDDDIKILQAEFSNVTEIDFKDFESIKDAKAKLAEDYVLKHQILNTPERTRANTLAIWHLRAYRRIYKEYFDEFSFLWIHSKFKSASSLYREVLRRSSES
jgi:hypothetical protein